MAGFIALFSNACVSQKKVTEYQKNKMADAGDSLTYEELVAALGKEKADIYWNNLGQDTLNLLSYGAGVSNVIQLMNNVSDPYRLIALIGNDFAGSGATATATVTGGVITAVNLTAGGSGYTNPPKVIITDATGSGAKVRATISGGAVTGFVIDDGGTGYSATPTVTIQQGTGLGAMRILQLLNRIDFYANSANGTRYDGTNPDGQTITRMSTFVNCMNFATPIGGGSDELSSKVIPFIDGLSDRTMSGANDTANLDKVTKLLAHVTSVNQVCDLMNQLTATAVLTIMTDVLNGVTVTDNLIEVIDKVTDTTKLAYVMENVTSANTLITLINGIDNAGKLGNLINEMEDNTTWTGQVNGPQQWGNPTPGQPSGPDSGMVRLVNIINGTATAPNPDKLLQIMNQVDTDPDGVGPLTNMTKMMRIITDLNNANDLITVITSLADPGINAVPSQNLGLIVENMQVSSVPKMVTLLDGRRNAFTGYSATQQPAYLGYLVQLVSQLDQVKEGPLKVTNIVDGVTNMEKMINIVYDVGQTPLANCSNGGASPANGERLAQVINDIDKASSAPPKDQAVNTLVYLIENVADPSKMVSMVCGITPTNLSTLVNEVACVSQAQDGSTNNSNCNTADGTRDAIGATQIAAGRKMANIVDNVTDVNDLIFVVNNVSTITKMAALVNQIDIGNGTTTGTARVATIMNNVSVEANAWNTTPTNDAATRGTSTGMGKLVNMIEYVNDPTMASMAQLINGIDGSLLGYLILGSGTTAGSTNSSNLVGLVNAILADATVSVTDMVNMMTSPYNLATDTTVHANPAQMYGDILGELVNTLNPATGTTT
ncbi:MAG: hypothetical protein D6767_05960, partial [Candidatus Hydrogenedentota bacterium]